MRLEGARRTVGMGERDNEAVGGRPPEPPLQPARSHRTSEEKVLFCGGSGHWRGAASLVRRTLPPSLAHPHIPRYSCCLCPEAARRKSVKVRYVAESATSPAPPRPRRPQGGSGGLPPTTLSLARFTRSFASF
jgi:hypothetical protein